MAALALLDLSSAFDSVDHDTLLQRLQTSCGFDGVALSWFASYLKGRVQNVRLSTTSSLLSVLYFAVQQGSVLGPILFLLYTTDLLQLFQCRQMTPHSYADDTQLDGFCRPSQVDELSNRVSASIDGASQWLRANRLQPFEDGNTVVCISTTPASATNWNHPGLRSGCFTNQIGP